MCSAFQIARCRAKQKEDKDGTRIREVAAAYKFTSMWKWQWQEMTTNVRGRKTMFRRLDIKAERRGIKNEFKNLEAIEKIQLPFF